MTLLAQDVADIAPPLLGRAIMEWARTKRFLPRAAELIEVARELEREDARANTDASYRALREHCDHLNSMGWISASGDPYVVIGHAPNRKIGRASERRQAAA